MLLQSCESPRASIKSSLASEDALGGCGYSTFLQTCVECLKQEKIVKCSPRGKKTQELLGYVEHMELGQLTDISMYLIQKINDCILVGSKRKLPSSARGDTWSAFHKLRCDDGIRQRWKSFITTYIPETHHQEYQLVLQLLMDRILKKLLYNKAKSSTIPQAKSVQPLNSRELNAIRYMAGYVAIMLLKRYKSPTKHPQLKQKYELFDQVLGGMKAADQPEDVNSLSDYTRLWTDLIDRGGLYHVTNEVN